MNAFGAKITTFGAQSRRRAAQQALERILAKIVKHTIYGVLPASGRNPWW